MSLIFLASAAGKITDWQHPTQMMADRGLPAVNVLLSVAVALEIIGGVSVLLGLYARFGALALLTFLIPVSAIMHNFWALEQGPERMGEMVYFDRDTKNMSNGSGNPLETMTYGTMPLS